MDTKTGRLWVIPEVDASWTLLLFYVNLKPPELFETYIIPN